MFNDNVHLAPQDYLFKFPEPVVADPKEWAILAAKLKSIAVLTPVKIVFTKSNPKNV